MRIVIEPSGHHLLNAGDVAMTQVAYRRLRTFWPHASIYITTSDPRLLQEYCPGAVPLDATIRRTALSLGIASGVLHYRVPAGFAEPERRLLHRSPGMMRMLARFIPGHGRGDVIAFLNLISSCDLVIATGAGQITDPFKDDAILTLNTLEIAASAGVPTCLVGQGIGPITNVALRARARAVLPRASFIALREGLQGLPVLADAGVDSVRVLTTGDDAIELAYAQRPAAMGDALGINVRLAEYARVDDHFEAIARTMRSVASELRAPLTSLAVSTHPRESDDAAAARILAGAEQLAPATPDGTIVDRLARQAGRSRVVVTGSYHAAVFALSQGVPVVGLANTPYYASKFAGLRDQFGGGCTAVPLDQPEVATRLRAAITESWQAADDTRPLLLRNAQRQIDLGYQAYARVRDCAEPASSR
jgi:polysaccharide pyruvyl transferase WcaK-like protein